MTTRVILEGPFRRIIEEPTGHVVEIIGGAAGGGGGSGDATSIQGIDVVATAPLLGFGLVFDGTDYVPVEVATKVQLDAVSASLATHAARVDNPHAVTAAQVGAYTIAAVDALLATKADTVHTHTFASLTSKPTTLAGYGITDAALDADLDAHVADTANPHAVTKTQVGLGLVENTALSTWAGSANLTTLGTIGTGVWNATAITWAKVSKTGSSLADLDTRSATDLTSGTLPDGRFPATLPAVSGVNLTALNATNIASGNLTAARLPSGVVAWTLTSLTLSNALVVTAGGLTVTAGGVTLTGAQTITTSTGNLTLATGAGNGNVLIMPNGTGRLLVGHTASIQTGGASALIQGHSTAAAAGLSYTKWSANNSGPSIWLAKSRGAAIGTFAAVQSNDDLGEIVAVGDDGTDLITVAASILFEADGAVSSNRVPGRMVLRVAAGSADDDLAEAWRITSTKVFQSPGANTIQTATGTLTLATAAGNGDVLISPNGTGRLRFGTFTGSADVAVTGSVEIKDAGGTTRKLATIA